MQADSVVEKVRNVSPIKIHEFGASFIELHNAGDSEVDLSNWSVTEHAIQQATFSSIKIPAGTKLAILFWRCRARGWRFPQTRATLPFKRGVLPA
jgi:hypothetical protein